MTGTSETFDSHLRSWHAWQRSPWGRLRYRTVENTLLRSLPDCPLRILDVGGGDGTDAIALARAGHDVTVLDFSEPLLGAARNAAQLAGVAGRVHTVHADLDDVPGADFDAVLCHNLLQYRTDPVGSVAQLVALTRVGGVLSLIAGNPASDVLAAAVRRLDLSEALELLDAATARTVTFDHDVRRLEASDIATALEANGCHVLHRFGIRCIADFITDDELKADPEFYARLEQLELAVCDREPFVHTARMWQLVAARG
ncbi:MAG: methyltransferase domain-containing protein [Geodermatophilaceae bacterium]|jgi:S-adenosylmethionine-dependent methyltransferase|nr:methyltransferase domain-containing protein [Geodermatophilaceae bacterium]